MRTEFIREVKKIAAKKRANLEVTVHASKGSPEVVVSAIPNEKEGYQDCADSAVVLHLSSDCSSVTVLTDDGEKKFQLPAQKKDVFKVVNTFLKEMNKSAKEFLCKQDYD